MSKMYKPRYGSRRFITLQRIILGGKQTASEDNPQNHNILHKKGLLERRKEGNLHVYYPTELGQKVYEEIVEDQNEKNRFAF